MANPAYLIWVGNSAGKVAEMIPSWSTSSSASTAKPMMVSAQLPWLINQNIGQDSKTKPNADTAQTGFGPTRSEARPTNVMMTIIAAYTMMVMINAPFAVRLIVV